MDYSDNLNSTILYAHSLLKRCPTNPLDTSGAIHRFLTHQIIARQPTSDKIGLVPKENKRTDSTRSLLVHGVKTGW